MPRAIGYIRVSTSEQATEGVSLDAQRAKISAWAVTNDYELVGIYEDAGITGTSLDKRPGLQEAIAQTGKGMALVAYATSSPSEPLARQPTRKQDAKSTRLFLWVSRPRTDSCCRVRKK